MTQSAFVLQLAPSGTNKLPEALASNQIMVGCAQAEGLLNPGTIWSEFNQTVRNHCFAEDEESIQSDKAAGQLWRFLREMGPGDLVLVPHGAEFFLAEVTGEAVYDPAGRDDNSAYRRPVRWLNNKAPIPRGLAGSALISRMRTPGICANSTDLLDDIKECLRVAQGERPTVLENALHARLLGEIRQELAGEWMDAHRFGELIRMLMLGLGASDCLPPKTASAQLNGHSAIAPVCLVATFKVDGAAPQPVLIQTQLWRADAVVTIEAVDQLAKCLLAPAGSANVPAAHHGLIATCGEVTADARLRAQAWARARQLRIELLDGEALAHLVTEHGIRGVPLNR